jgi:hypothetical protein
MRSPQAAPEEIAERVLDGLRQALAVAQRGGMGWEHFEVVAGDAVEDVVARRPTLIDPRR